MYEPVPGHHAEPGVIPANWAIAGYGIPSVCARHGAPSTWRAKVKLQSDPPGWTYALIPLGVITYLIVIAAIAKTVRVPAWPFCRRCGSLRAKRIMLGLAGIPAMLAICILAGKVDLPGAWIMAVMAVEALMFVLMIYAFWMAEHPRIARARVSRDGLWVEVKDPAIAFQAEIDAARIGTTDDVSVR